MGRDKMVLVRNAEERRRTELRLLQERQDAILQKRKEWAYLKEWRTDGRKLQQQRECQRLNGQLVYEEPAKQAPYAVDKRQMKVLTNAERMSLAKTKQEKERPKPISPHSLHLQEQERAKQDRDLGRRIMEHTATMQQRRLEPKSSPQVDMQVATEDLRIAEQLHKAIKERRCELEYS